MHYEWNDAAELLAEHLISAYHQRLAGLKIAFLYKGEEEDPDKPKKFKPVRSGRKQTWAKTAKVTDKWRELAEEDYRFVIEFDRAIWDELSLQQQEALVDHELCHCGNDADGCYMRQHDLEEFREIVDRHGFWKDDVRDFAEATLPLFDKVEAAKRWTAGVS